MKLHTDIQQGTEEWLRLRLGKFTASTAQAIATNGKGLETLVFEKVAETMTGKLKEQYTNEDIERGHALEMIARNNYELETGNVVSEIAFIEMDEKIGCSPDGLIAEDGLVEIKCMNDAKFARYMYEMKIDPAHQWQMQMQMLVSGRQWADYVVYNENFKRTTIIQRVTRNEADINKLRAGLVQGVAMLETILEKLQ